MPTPTLRVVTTEREGPRDKAGHAAGLCQRTALPIPPAQLSLVGPRSSWEDERAEMPFDLGPPPELGLDVDCFLQELASSTREDSGNDSSPEPPAEDYERWVTWQGQALNMPDWWQELAEISEVDDPQELARKIRASFELPQQIGELHGMENYHLALLAPPWLCQKDFLLPQDPKFPCSDIWMAQVEKMMAYALVLQFWAEKSNLPAPGQPHLLVGSVLELREVMESYFSFPTDAILSRVAPLEGFLEEQLETTISGSPQPTSVDSPIKEAAMKEATPVEGAATEEAAPIGRPQEEPSTFQTLSR